MRNERAGRRSARLRSHSRSCSRLSCRGLYPENIALDVSPERLERFFSRRHGQYQVVRRIRDMIVFATQNVTKDPPYSRLDLISCRNLLIYLQPPLQRKVLRIFHYALNAGGFLLLGTSESVGDSSDLFSFADRRNKLYAKRGSLSAAAFDVHVREPAARLAAGATASPLPREARPQVSVQALADRKVLERFGPPGVVVDEHGDVLQFRGRTGAFLDPSPGVATLNLLKLARPELALELRGLLARAQREDGPVSTRRVNVRTAEGTTTVDIEVVPITVGEPAARCLLVLFVTPPRDGEDERPPAPEATADESSDADTQERRRVQALEEELAATKEHLQTTIEELETANEELQSANEELQSANEELQSINEELETSQEELQSTNEELTTVNHELQTRMDELSRSNDDLSTVLLSIDTALVFVGLDLRVRRFTLAAQRLLNLVPATSAGRSGTFDPPSTCPTSSAW